MSRTALITYEQIAAAADNAAASGLRPTMRLIRERIGNVGSIGTVAHFLQQWRTEKQRMTDPALSLPVDMQRSIIAFTEQHVSGARARFEVDLDEQQQENADLAGENERLCEQVETLRTELEIKAAKQTRVEKRLRQLEADLEQARAENGRDQQRAEQARMNLAREQLRLEWLLRMDMELAELRVTVASERTTRVSAEQNAAVLASQRNDLIERLEEARALGASDRSLITQLRDRLDTPRHEPVGGRAVIAGAASPVQPQAPTIPAQDEQPARHANGGSPAVPDEEVFASSKGQDDASHQAYATVTRPARAAKSGDRRAHGVAPAHKDDA
ncbi:DNA-binding protein [Rugamonas apoptosis]|uniref:DNA-binding protein n=1 Tax=Rugamonas apoptosis TaxID=2758570 RepID=A0A7W2F6V1_9BURK|nr:DNA-binding protein [Rugamonas apoptosis]MBA5686169.1 DNA-binding protein [Rugamonas apoptosis]